MAVVENVYKGDFSSYEKALRNIETLERKAVDTAVQGAKKVEQAHKQSAASIQQTGEKAATAFKGAKTEASSLTKTVDRLGTRLLAAFAIERIIRFFATTTKEMINLAKQAVPVRKTFERIADPKLLDNLRKAVKGTVSDLKLMAQAVKAENLEIPIKNLATLFEFAQRRARDTGESVDALVESIVSGIGRRSPLVLDNLGISAVRLRGELKGVGIETASIAKITEAVGRIVQEEMAQMGGSVDEVADKMDRAAASMENAQTVIGEELLPFVGFLSEAFTQQVEIMRSDEVPLLTKLGIAFLDLTPAIGLSIVATNEWTESLAKSAKELEATIKLYDDFKDKIDLLAGGLEELPNTNILDPVFDLEGIETIGQYEEKIKQVRKAIKLLKPDTDELTIANAFLVDIQDILNKATGKTTQADKDLKDETKRLTKEQRELDAQFKRVSATLQKEFTRASQAAKRAIAEFIKETKKANDDARTFGEIQEQLALNNAELQAELNNDLVAIENAAFQKRLASLKLQNTNVEDLTEEEKKAIELLTSQHIKNLRKIESERSEVLLENAEFELRLKKLKEDLKEREATTNQSQRAIELLTEQHQQNLDGIAKDGFQFFLDTASETFGIIAEFNNRRLEAELMTINSREDAEQQSFNAREARLSRELELNLSRLEQSDLTKEKQQEAEGILLSQFDTRVKAERKGLEDLEQERKRVQFEQAQDAKALAIFEATINVAKAVTAQGVTTPQAIAAGILGALQILLIQTQPLPAFKDGVIGIKGAGTERSDSIVARLSVNESVIQAAGTRAYSDELYAANNLTLPALIDKKYVQPAVQQAVTDIYPMVSATMKDKNHHVIISNTRELAKASQEQAWINSYLG